MNTVEFDYNNYKIGSLSFDFNRTQAQGGKLYPRLILPVELSLKQFDVSDSKLPRFIITTALAELSVEGVPFKVSDSVLLLPNVEFRKKYDREHIFYFDFPLDILKVKAIEASRSGDIKLKLAIKIQFGIYKILNSVENSLESTSFIDDFQSKLFDLTIDIPQSFWVNKIIPKLGLGEFFIIEVPQGNKTIEDAWKYLNEAEISLRNWNSKGVFGNCREIGVHLDLQLKSKFGKDSFIYSQRWRRSYDNFNHLASLELHLEDLSKSQKKFSPEEIRTQKIDSEHLILSSKLLIKYAEELLNE